MASRKALAALEKVFAAEIEGRLPFQSRAAIYKTLCEKGLLAPMERTYSGGRGQYTMRVAGYELTHAGRITYFARFG